MLNCIRMDLYRMFQMKSFFVIGFVLLIGIFFSTSMSVTDYNMMKEELENNPQAYEQEFLSEEELINIGMNVMLPTKIGETVTVYDQVYANLNGKFITIFMVIFAVLFSSSDLSSGYIKNIGGQIENRGKLILSKAVVLFGYTVLTMIFYFIMQIVAQGVYYKTLEMGQLKELMMYIGTQTLLHYALLLICMAITIIAQSKVFSMTTAVLFCMNIMVILYSTIDKIVAKFGVKDFNLVRYTVTGRMSLLTMTPSAKECGWAILIAALFGLGVTVLSSQVFRKRDI